jgi:hypothetical protein
MKSESKTLTAGYSGTPLVKKLGIKPGFNAVFVNAPADFVDGLKLPPDVVVNRTTQQRVDFAMLFVKSEKELKQKFSHLAAKLKPTGMLWIAWPKKSSGVVTDLSFTNVQLIGLDSGLVDTKICAVDDTWSGLKFVIRLKDEST